MATPGTLRTPAAEIPPLRHGDRLSREEFVLRQGQYVRLAPDASGIYRSEVFPGIWLDAPALLRGDMPAVFAVLQQGIACPEHAAFVARLRQATASTQS